MSRMTLVPWPGSKTEMLKHILTRIPIHKSYVEPFCGGASVFWYKDLSDCNLINDMSDLLVNFFRVAKLKPIELTTFLDATLKSRNDRILAAEYLKNKDQHSDVELAWAFWVNYALSVSSMGGGFNTDNRYVIFNRVERLKEVLYKLQNTTIEKIDGVQCIKIYDKWEKNTFMYIDPPYIDTCHFDYSKYTTDDYIKLLDQLEKTKANWMLSSFDNDILTEYVNRNKWFIEKFPRNNKLKTSTKENIVKKIEVLVMNYDYKEIKKQKAIDLLN
jgi:DNA adenine methylase